MIEKGKGSAVSARSPNSPEGCRGDGAGGDREAVGGDEGGAGGGDGGDACDDRGGGSDTVMISDGRTSDSVIVVGVMSHAGVG